MADNLTTQSATLATIPASTKIATREVTYSGDASSHIAPTGVVLISGSDDAKTATDVSASNPFPVTSAADEESYHASLVRGRAEITDGASTQILAAAGASVRNYVTGVSIANTSASTLTVDLRDGTAGSVMWTFVAPAGGGVVFDFSSPLRGSANTAVAADPSAAATTVTVSISGYTAA